MPEVRARLAVRELASIDAVAAAEWNALTGTDCPFLRHEFLAALEHSGCTTVATGWTPAHLTLFDGATLVAAAPAYRKTHSWGEFVFDFGWAQAYARHGLSYFPKLTCAAPFSPVNGERLLTRPGQDAGALREHLIRELMATAGAQRLSSVHALFIDSRERSAFEHAGWLLRRDVQFHWSNAGYRSFDEYLEGFTAEKRKKVRRERRRCEEAGLVFETLMGNQLDDELLRQVYALHERNFHRHGHEPYLNLAFFREITRTMGDAVMVKLARHEQRLVAAAVFLRSRDVLYGRYWGATVDFHSLHFETCYHQGIEYCIEHGIQRFEPGTQGEHKVSRGFVPQLTWSAHYIVEPAFREAIAEFLHREAPAVESYAQQIEAHSPFRKS